MGEGPRDQRPKASSYFAAMEGVIKGAAENGDGIGYLARGSLPISDSISHLSLLFDSTIIPSDGYCDYTCPRSPGRNALAKLKTGQILFIPSLPLKQGTEKEEAELLDSLSLSSRTRSCETHDF
ncbi:hypothetical protein K1719_006654 [Acacia pycnantha]|nr:hypothetical protein K1719_006654 [Acacia pycnantha]